MSRSLLEDSLFLYSQEVNGLCFGATHVQEVFVVCESSIGTPSLGVIVWYQPSTQPVCLRFALLTCNAFSLRQKWC